MAHENDAVRAVYAALELQGPVPEMDFIGEVRVGVAQGQVWAGAYGSSSRRTYGAMGSRVNLAARLMQAASGTILCDETICRGAQGHIHFEPLAAIKVKGILEPVPNSNSI